MDTGIRLLKIKFHKKFFIDFLMDVLRDCFLKLKMTKNVGIVNIPLYDTYKFVVAYFERELGLNFSKHPNFKLI